MTRHLAVWLHSDRVGVLSQTAGGRISFAYDDAWLASPRPMPLSLSLPLRAEPYDEPSCRPFFAGLLPEEGARRAIASALHVSVQNDFALLDELGGECAGAVTLLPPDEAPEPPANWYRPLSIDELAGLIRQLPRRPLLAGEDGVRISLAGAQGKLAVKIEDGKYFLPLDGSPSTHILKPAIPGFPETVENEAFCLRLARKLGLDTAGVDVRILDDDLSILEVRRYDRIIRPDGTIQRLHQEDLCQASGVLPRLKYEAEGGPSIVDCVRVLRQGTAAPGASVVRLLDAVIFNAIIGNNDAHAKNFSILWHPDGDALSPLYDLVSTHVYPNLSRKMAMRIGSTFSFEQTTADDWARLASDAQLGRVALIRRALEIAERIPAVARFVAEEMASMGEETVFVHEIGMLIARRCDRLRQLLGGLQR